MLKRSPRTETPDTSSGAKHARGIHWVVLIVSAFFESGWALALDASDGFSKPLPTVLFFVLCTLSMVGLSMAMRGIPISVAYAVWTGLGAATTVTVSMITGSEPVSALKIVFLAGIIGCVIGLKFVGEKPRD